MPVVKKQSVRKTKKKTTKKTAKGVLGRIESLGFDIAPPLKVCVYGESGTGKTTFCATFPKRSLIILCTGIPGSGELLSIDTAEYRGSIDVAKVEHPDDIRDIVSDQMANEKYETIHLENLPGLQDLRVKEELGLAETPLALYRKPKKGEAWGLVSKGQWGQINLKTNEALRALLGLKCAVVIVSHERIFNQDAEEYNEFIRPYIGPAATPGITSFLRANCNYLCYTFTQQKRTTKVVKIGKKHIEKSVTTKGIDYCMRIAPGITFRTKFRVPKGTPLPDYIVDPTYEAIKKLIRQGG